MSDFPPRKRRARHDIILQILKIAENGAKKTRIMLKARLSFDQLEQYLNHLSTAGFIIAESGIWKTTKKGLDVIEACELCCRLTEEIQ
ncbi:MAG: hypothetical protein GWN31_11060 [Candidatus Thorarchaeota archaeon]|nr:hypothetical protein [Candidatus Thorarchaeota archaeon]